MQYTWLQPSDVVGAAGLGVAGGLGARGIRHLVDLYRGKEDDTDFGATPTPAIKVPVEVTPEEAAQLQQHGVQLKKKLAGFVNNVAMGVAGTAGALGGWQALDSFLENRRRNRVKGELESTRQRVQKLLEDNPAQPDLALHATMKAAEDLWFEKEALDLSGYTLSNMIGSAASKALQGADTALGTPYLGVPMGIFGTLAALSAYRESRKNKYDQAAGAVRGFYQRQKEQVPQAELEPVVVEHHGQPKIAAGRKEVVEFYLNRSKERELKDLGKHVKGRLNGGPAR